MPSAASLLAWLSCISSAVGCGRLEGRGRIFDGPAPMISMLFTDGVDWACDFAAQFTSTKVPGGRSRIRMSRSHSAASARTTVPIPSALG
jgi:hypothetical protein